jgi:hypothetical protein
LVLSSDMIHIRVVEGKELAAKDWNGQKIVYHLVTFQFSINILKRTVQSLHKLNK